MESITLKILLLALRKKIHHWFSFDPSPGIYIYRLVLISALTFTSSQCFSQSLTTYHHNLFWGRIVLSDRITDKLKWEVYLQERTQNDDTSKLNIFKHHQVFNYWIWLHYQATRDLRVSITPFCYFNTIAYFPQPSEIGNRGINEYRWAAQLEHTQKFKYLQFASRYSIEYRYRDLETANVYVPNFRIRYRARLEKPLKNDKHPMSLILYDEVFLEFGEAVKASPAIFNHNRLYAGFSYEIVKNVKFSLGYMNIIQERFSGKAIDVSNTLWGILSFDNLFSQFFKANEKTAETKK